MESLVGPEESKEPMAMEAFERGEYSSEPLREEEYGDGGKSHDEEWKVRASKCDGGLRGAVILLG